MVLAIGSQIYLMNLQGQSSQGYQQAISTQVRRASEILDFTLPAAGLTVVNGGPTTTRIIGMYIKYPNGSVYSGSTFSGRDVASSSAVAVQGLVPSGVCLPTGTSTCSSRYGTVVGSATPGYAIGLLTSLGNTFWYAPASSANNPIAPNYFHTTGSQTTTSASFVSVNGLSFTGTPNSFYTVEFFVGYLHSNAANPALAFAISVPSGASFLFCGGFLWSDASSSSTDSVQGNLCNSSPGTSLGPIQPQAGQAGSLCTTTSNGCEFVGTAFVSFGATSGQFQVQFRGSSSDTATVVANSAIIVTHG